MKVAFLTAGGNAPCLAASIVRLIKNYSEADPAIEMIGYLHGYKGLLSGKFITISKDVIDAAEILYEFGGSPIGNSRVKLSNIDDCIKKGYIKEGDIPLEVAANQLIRDKIINYIPLQLRCPSPSCPSRHVQLKEPIVLLQ